MSRRRRCRQLGAPAQLEAAEPHAPDAPAADPVPAEDERIAGRRRMEWGAW